VTNNNFTKVQEDRLKAARKARKADYDDEFSALENYLALFENEDAEVDEEELAFA